MFHLLLQPLFSPAHQPAPVSPGAGAGSSAEPQAGQALGSWWDSRTGPRHGESGQPAPLGPPREFVSSGREGCLNGKLKRDMKSYATLCRGAGRFLLGTSPGRTHPARSQMREKGPNRAKFSHVLVALQVQDLSSCRGGWLSQLAMRGHPERGDNAGRVGSGGKSARQKQSSVDTSNS